MNMSDGTACSYYRAILPVAMCREHLLKEGIVLDLSDRLSRAYDYDCYIFHRVLNSTFFPYFYDMKFHARKKIVWDTDDDLFSIPDWSPANEAKMQGRLETYTLCMHLADKITLTTNIFKENYSSMFPDWRDKINVLPNLIDMNQWDIKTRSNPQSPVRVLWSGSLTHQKDIDLVGPPIENLIEKYKDKVQFIFMGMMPERLQITPNNVNSMRGNVCKVGICDLAYYPFNLSLLSPDIALIPVTDCLFNQCKSNIKYLEMTMAGAACVASSVGPYKESIDHNSSGFLVADESSWKDSIDDAISIAITNSNTFFRIRFNAFEKCKNLYSWQSPTKEKWLDFFRSLAEEPVCQPDQPSLLPPQIQPQVIPPSPQPSQESI